MNINYLLKYAFNFENKIKQASLQANMAKRILFSLLSHLVPVGEQARVAYTKGMVDSKALKQMIPGAKEIIDYGIKACIDEASHYYKSLEVKTKIEELKKLSDKKYVLSSLIEIFKLPYWDSNFGGPLWAKIASTLLNIQTHLENAQEAKKNYDWDKENEELMNMTAYVNVLDGLAHNTGSIMDKMLQIENLDNDDWESIEKQKSNILRMMDVKELEDPDDIIQEILPTLDNETDASLTMKDWMTAARKKKHEYKGNLEEKEEKLKKIRMKKKLINDLNQFKIPKIKLEIQKILNLPDNFMVEKIKNNKFLFSALIYAFKNLKTYILPEEAKLKLSSCIILMQNITNNIIDEQSFHDLRNNLAKILNTIFYIENL